MDSLERNWNLIGILDRNYWKSVPHFGIKNISPLISNTILLLRLPLELQPSFVSIDSKVLPNNPYLIKQSTYLSEFLLSLRLISNFTMLFIQIKV